MSPAAAQASASGAPGPGIETTATIEVYQSPQKMLALGVACIGLLAASAFSAFGPPSRDPGSFATFIGWFGLIFFGLCGAVLVWRAITVRGPTLTLSPAGLLDIRVSARPIPWSEVRGLSTWSYRNNKILIVDVAPQVEQQIGLTRMAAWTRGPNRALGADGLAVASQGLKISYAQLFDLACAYANAYGRR